MAQILVIESDPATASAATNHLTEAGFEVLAARDVEEGLHLFQAGVDAIVVDLGLERSQGHDLCHGVREVSEVPILVLTELSEDGDVDDGSAYGADDYLTKPFTGAVLVARVRALLRRASRRVTNDHIIQVRDLLIDLQRHQVFFAGRQVNLTPTEFRLLTCLARNAGRVMASRDLLRDAQGYECEDQEAQEIVKVHINHLRQKIEPAQGSPAYIVNVRGFGYMLERRASHTKPQP